MSEEISVNRINKSYDANSSPILRDIEFSFKKSEFIALIGPNGSGKTTLLNLLAGLDEPNSGSVSILGKQPKEARISYLFQNYRESLLPWLKNIDNIGFSLVQILNKKDRRTRVRQFLENIRLKNLPLNHYPYQLSGGQQQLVAIARELIYEPELLLLDEPFAALDFERRLDQQQQLLRYWSRSKPAILMVSHEIEEAIWLADKVMLLSRPPSEIVDVFDVDLPRPRNVEMLNSQRLLDLKVKITERFLEVIST